MKTVPLLLAALVLLPAQDLLARGGGGGFRGGGDFGGGEFREGGMDDAAFRQLFSGSPVKRTGRDRFIRNVLIAAGNSGATELAPQAEALLADPSPLVRAMAVWALSRLLPEPAFARLRSERMMTETDEDVRREWETA